MTLRIVRRPETVQVLLAAFDSISAAGQTVSDIIAASMLPAAMEMMDRLAIQAAEAAVHPHYPECEALLLVELDGPAAEVDLQMEQVRELCKANGAWEVRLAQSEQERLLVWKGRKAAFAAAGRLSPDYIVQDGVIPRTKLPIVLEQIAEMAAEAGLRVANVFHAGDGNLHPLVLYDRSIPGQEETAIDLSMRILLPLRRSWRVHHRRAWRGQGEAAGDGLHVLRARPGDDATGALQLRPGDIANPDKLFPRPRLCGEKTGKYTPHPLETAGVAEFF